ncbi:aldehyde dehydrogenase family protein [Pleomorphomonas sp. NRK KF1]|uniref:aldehyde dehydrogenase family protein n=1 Tax=Pleomorphomonas sp. NRK KF1 TaxID=2943000 RepID=UPI002043BA27|nr:aldehyde dehydrogenase family protein [Pleomorphomonas sp. NRK KF1]MCM5554243.1 aldehyde dehydrogenase family protein [Pleomorphomonas sp. NRK KF1]
MSDLMTLVSPVDGSVYAERPIATEAEMNRVFRLARDAQKGWARLPLETRIDYCLKALDAMLAMRPRIAEELTWQMGRPIRFTPYELNGVEQRTRHMANIAAASLAPLDSGLEFGGRGAHRYINREPLGVVFVVAPWNYPYLTTVNSVMPALMAGNTVVLKHSDQTLLVAERFQDAFDAAGLPEGVFQHIVLSHDQTAAAIAARKADMVAFTGSVAGGVAMERAAVGTFIAVNLELGGKDPAYVRPDAKLDFAIENVADGAFFNSGQCCCGIERVYVHEKVYDDFVAGLVDLARKYVLGNPTDPAVTLGPMARARGAATVREQIAAALRGGAVAHVDPKSFPTDAEGTPYIAPQVLTSVNHQMAFMTEETFGPAVGIMKVRDDAEAVALMNDSKYGLTCSLWTEDLDAAEAIGQELETGTVFANRCDYLDPALTWTGVKDTGRGAALSPLGFQGLTRPKSWYLRQAPV